MTANKYGESGVDIAAGNRFVELIKPFAKSTYRRGVLSGVGGFGGLFALTNPDIKEPVLVAGTDGVGTKLKIAIELGILDTIGQDLVAMCVNDIACSGAEPLFFLDYFACGKLKPEEHSKIVEGIANACKMANCALLGGETAELPGFYAGEDFDLAGFAVGVVDRKKIIDGSEIAAGNAIIGVASSGFHSNGYSLVRKIIKDAGLDLGKTYDEIGENLGEAILRPTHIYSPLITQLAHRFSIKGIAHITGGGWTENIPRCLPNGVQAVIEKMSWDVPPLFRFFQMRGGVSEDELFRVFNCGIGLVLVAPANEAKDICHAASTTGFDAKELGRTALRSKGAPPIIFK